MGVTPPYEFIAIGLGPFNLSLACLMAPLKEHSCLFLERNAGFDWHPGMLLDDATLQNPFLADLVSLADPTSRFSYLNYCRHQGKLYRHFIRENFYLTRREFNAYCRWAVSQLTNLRFDSEVTRIEHDASRGEYVVAGRDGRSGRLFEHRCRRLVLGIGSVPHFPACCDPVHPYVHTAGYLQHKARLQTRRSITIVGSGQSAAEVYHDLLKDSPRHDYALNWITRSSRFVPMEYVKLTIELSTPEYGDHYFALTPAKKQQALHEQKAVYNGINARLINDIYDLLAERRAAGDFRGRLLTHCELQGCRFDEAAGEYALTFLHTEQERRYAHRTDGLVLATGYAHRVPALVDPIRHRIRWDEQGRYLQARNYSVDAAGTEVFVQNAGFHCHGLTSPDLGMTCLRNARLIHALTGVEYYPVELKVALQDFAPPAGGPLVPLAPEGVR
jgi:lysine N6-hydroxylase